MATRIFKYQDQRWDDPGEGFSTEDVRKQLATFYPELAQATANERTLEDGTVEVEFVKRAGTKGLGGFTGSFATRWVEVTVGDVVYKVGAGLVGVIPGENSRPKMCIPWEKGGWGLPVPLTDEIWEAAMAKVKEGAHPELRQWKGLLPLPPEHEECKA